VPELSKRAARDLEDLPQALQAKARNLISRLDAEPTLGKKLLGHLSGKRSLWLGRSHRIIYRTEPEIFIVSITPRRDAYR
jgi:mRNA-degrading endonuclease RelE of RelBE toxin-antitoxin system